MTWNSATYQIDGGNTTSQLWRQALEAVALGSQALGGIMNPLDLVATVTGTNAVINLATGACLIDGQEIVNQGMYYGYNVGTDSSQSISPTSGSPRSDMVVSRAEDPTFA